MNHLLLYLTRSKCLLSALGLIFEFPVHLEPVNCLRHTSSVLVSLSCRGNDSHTIADNS